MGRRAFGRAFGAITAAALAALLTGCGSREIMRYKLIVKVETPQGVRTGHSVIEVVWTRSGPVDKALFGGLAGGGFQIKGEAVAVDLPALKGQGSQTLFVLLRSAGSADWAGWLSNDVPKDKTARPVPRTDNMGTANYPYFVRFANPADPKSVEQVDPDNLAKSYGAGYALKSLTVQMTDEAVTSEIEKRLGWLKEHRGTLKPNPPKYLEDAKPMDLISSGDFSTELYR